MKPMCDYFIETQRIIDILDHEEYSKMIREEAEKRGISYDSSQSEEGKPVFIYANDLNDIHCAIIKKLFMSGRITEPEYTRCIKERHEYLKQVTELLSSSRGLQVLL